MSNQSIVLRAQEIINNADEPITAHEAIARALKERYRTIDEIAQVAAAFMGGMSRKLAKATYELPEANGLFEISEIPAAIAINTSDGPLFIHRQDATFAQVDQWSSEMQRHHAAQKLRVDRFRDDLKLIRPTIDGSTPWEDVRRQIGTLKRAAVER